MSDDSEGSDLPTMSADQKAAFDAEAKAAETQRASMKGLGAQRLVQEPEGGGEGDPAPAPAAKPAAPTAPATPPAKPAAPATAAPAAGEDDEPTAVTDTKGRRFVPLETLTGTRQKLSGTVKDLQAALKDAQDREKQLLAALGRPAPAAPAPATPAAPAPEPPKNPYNEETHPLEHAKWETQQIKKSLDDIVKARDTEVSTAAERQKLANAQAAYVDIHKGFAGAPENKGYAHAYEWITNGWKAQFLAAGYSEREALQLANNTEWQFVQRAVANNVHPSSVIWNMAKSAGWKPEMADPAPNPTPAPAPAAPTAAEKIELAATGADAAISLSDASGGAAPAAPTLASIAAMGKEEFYEKFVAGDAGQAAFRKMMMPKRGGAGAA